MPIQLPPRSLKHSDCSPFHRIHILASIAVSPPHRRPPHDLPVDSTAGADSTNHQSLVTRPRVEHENTHTTTMEQHTLDDPANDALCLFSLHHAGSNVNQGLNARTDVPSQLTSALTIDADRRTYEYSTADCDCHPNSAEPRNSTWTALIPALYNGRIWKQ